MSDNESDGMHTESLEPPKPPSANPMVPIIEELFSTVLSGDHWRQFTMVTPDSFILMVQDKAKERGLSPTERHLSVLIRKLTKCDTTRKCLEVLGEQLY